MGNVLNSVWTAFQHAIHELLISIFDLLIYLALILLTMCVGKLLGLVLKTIFRGGSAIVNTKPKRALQSAFTPLSSTYHKLP
uniref:E protein n=1 Tax=Kibale red colobus virus 2 TaxID=1936072 RepID=X2D5E4_9NIDO|nr:E protein [Kibale red colobus virus 2]